jgi:enterochelin esterase-like enzyme
MTSRFRTLRVSDPRFEVEHLRFVTLKSPALGRRADVTLYVPPGIAAGAAPLPLLILLHGVHGSHWHWAFRGGAHRTAGRMIESGALRPMLLAMPSDGLWGDGSGYLAHGGADYENYIIEEVPSAVAEVTGLRAPDAGFFLAGLSMGGFGALRLGAQHPGRVKGISVHSAVTELSQLGQFIEEPLEAYEVPSKEDGSALHWLAKKKGSLPPLRFDCGTKDSLIGANRELHRGLLDQGIPHTYQEHDGEHNFEYWEKRLPDTLLFVNGLL